MQKWKERLDIKIGPIAVLMVMVVVMIAALKLIF
jgi:hypothetical protein